MSIESLVTEPCPICKIERDDCKDCPYVVICCGCSEVQNLLKKKDNLPHYCKLLKKEV